jgi:hypothetical protein
LSAFGIISGTTVSVILGLIYNAGFDRIVMDIIDFLPGK